MGSLRKCLLLAPVLGDMRHDDKFDQSVLSEAVGVCSAFHRQLGFAKEGATVFREILGEGGLSM